MLQAHVVETCGSTCVHRCWSMLVHVDTLLGGIGCDVAPPTDLSYNERTTVPQRSFKESILLVDQIM